MNKDQSFLNICDKMPATITAVHTFDKSLKLELLQSILLVPITLVPLWQCRRAWGKGGSVFRPRKETEGDFCGG